MINKEDSILIISNSGETTEIISILPALKRSTPNIFTLTNNSQSTIAKASKNQVNSIKDDIATTAEEKDALNSISGSNNTAIDSGTDTQGVAAGGQGNQDIDTHNTHNRGGAGGNENNTADVGVSDNISSTDNLQSPSASGTRCTPAPR